MDFTTTITRKGQITLSKKIREKLKVKPLDKVALSVKGSAVRIERIKSFMDLAGFLPPKKGKDALKAREYMESHYFDAIV